MNRTVCIFSSLVLQIHQCKWSITPDSWTMASTFTLYKTFVLIDFMHPVTSHKSLTPVYTRFPPRTFDQVLNYYAHFNYQITINDPSQERPCLLDSNMAGVLICCLRVSLTGGTSLPVGTTPSGPFSPHREERFNKFRIT